MRPAAYAVIGSNAWFRAPESGSIGAAPMRADGTIAWSESIELDSWDYADEAGISWRELHTLIHLLPAGPPAG